MPNRLKFFLSHLSMSFLIACIAISLVFLLWYPVPLAKAAGVTHLFLMLLAIDVIIGPILGFLVYKQGKKSLKFDLTVIIILQLSAFIYGFYNIVQGRPVYIAYVADRFELVRNNELVTDHIDKALPQFQHPSYAQPQFVATKLAMDTQQRNNDLFAEVMGGISLAQKPERYVDVSQATVQIKQRAQDLKLLDQFNKHTAVADILLTYPQAVAWVPLKANAVDMVVLLDNKNAVVKIVDLRPWK